MTEYYAGHVKKNPANGDVAIRTIFQGGSDVPQIAMMEWLIASSVTGPRHTWTQEVDTWDDLVVAEAPTPPPGS